MQYKIDILLVEDNRSDAELTILALKKKFTVNNIVHLKDGAEAVDFLFGEGAYVGRSIVENIPKIILLDLKMPKVTGLEVLQRLKSDPRTKSIPVIVLSSSKEDPDINACYELGANSYIVKPVQFDQFMNAVASVGMYWMMLNELPS